MSGRRARCRGIGILGVFEDSARALLTGVILHALYTETQPSLGSCLRLLSSPAPVEAWKAMQTAEHDPAKRRGWLDREGKESATHPAVASAASRLLGMDIRTATGVQATAQSKLVLFEDPVVCANTASSDFRGEDLIGGERPVSASCASRSSPTGAGGRGRPA